MISDDLIDGLYEAAAIPGLWPQVLDRVSKINHSLGGVLFVANSHFTGWVASEGMRPIFEQFIRDGWASKNPRPGRALLINRAGFVDDYDMFTDEEMNQDPTYQYFRSKNIGWCTGTNICVPTGDVLIFSWERRYDQGPFDRKIVRELDVLRPHLARAALLSSRLALQRAQAAAEALAAVGLPAAVLSGAHRVRVANSLLQDLIPTVVQDRKERVGLTDKRADVLLSAALAQISGLRASQKAARSIPIAAANEAPPYIAHIIPIVGTANDLFSMASYLLIVMPITMRTSPGTEIIQGLFDLTAAESRVASCVVRGESLDSISTASGVTVDTVRKQLKAVFQKTGVSRQADLVGLLRGTALPPLE